MEFSNSYYEDEVINGYYVPSLIKRGWAAQLEVLNVVVELCKKHNIQYFAEWGTLLGAVRHKGFIPWDDDIDISMKRDDYEKFISIAQKELPEGYSLLNTYTDSDFEDILSRVVNSRFITFESDYLEKFHGFPFTAGIDIFPMDYLGRDEEEMEANDELFNTVFGLARAIEGETLTPKQFEYMLKQVEEVCDLKLDRNKPMKRQLFRLGEALFGMYPEEESDFLTFMALWQRDRGCKFPKRYYAESVELPFENIMLSAPIGYDAILRKKYGDYMQLVRKGGGHDYPFFSRQENTLKKEAGIQLFNCPFDDDWFKRDEYIPKKKTSEIVLEKVNILRSTYYTVINLILEEKYDDIFEIMEQCQSIAISLGEQIDKIKGEGTESVKLLEKYCEILFILYEVLNGRAEADINQLNQEVGILFDSLYKSVTAELKSKKIIVFLPFKASAWDSFSKEYKNAVEDDDNEVYVIPVPYFDKNLQGDAKVMHYEGEEFPEDVKITDYETFDLEAVHPDIIYFQNPYDEYNLATSVHPYYYSVKLKNYTDKLIYIPWFKMDDFGYDDERAIKNMKYYTTVPGLANADKIILQSDQMKEMYISALVEWAGEDTKEIWENKIFVDEALKESNVQIPKEDIVLSKEWKEKIIRSDGSWKKVLLYVTNVDSLLEYEDKALLKIEKVMKTFQIYTENLIVIWKPDSNIDSIIKNMRPSLYEKYIKIIEKYTHDNVGIFDNSESIEKMVQLSDAYYGDAGAVVQLFRNCHKPVMIQSVEIGI